MHSASLADDGAVSIAGAVSAQSAGIRRNIPERGTNTLSHGNGRLESGLVTGTRGGHEGWENKCDALHREGQSRKCLCKSEQPARRCAHQFKRTVRLSPSVFLFFPPFISLFRVCLPPPPLDSRAPILFFRSLGRAIPSLGAELRRAERGRKDGK